MRLLASAFRKESFDIILLPQKLFLGNKLLTIVLPQKVNWVRIAATPVAILACSDEVVLSIRPSLRDWHEMIENEVVFR